MEIIVQNNNSKMSEALAFTIHEIPKGHGSIFTNGIQKTFILQEIFLIQVKFEIIKLKYIKGKFFEEV